VLQEICSRSSFIYFVACIFGLFLKLQDGVFLAALGTQQAAGGGWRKKMRAGRKETRGM
jgi:hypothetical protein